MRKVIVFLHDLSISAFAWGLAFWLRFNFEIIPENQYSTMLDFVPYVLFSQAISILFWQSYRSIWTFVSFHELVKILKISLGSGFILIMLLFFTKNVTYVPRSVVPCHMMFIFMCMSSSRFLRRLIVERRNIKTNNDKKKRAIIVGAGNAGAMLVRDMLNNPNSMYDPIGFLDDRMSKQGREIYGVRVLGRLPDVKKIAAREDVFEIIVAIPSAGASKIKKIIDLCWVPGVVVSKLPYITEIISNRVAEDVLRKVELDELLGREVLGVECESIGHLISGKTVMITGAGGSIGSELCRQIASHSPKMIVAVDCCEFNLFKIEQELSASGEFNLSLNLLDVKDEVGIDKLFARLKPEIVLHAAAYKHVPMLEYQVRCAVLNNVIGTYNVANFAIAHGVEKFILVSTDKAVNPTNVMGETKRAAELVCQALNNKGTTRFITVRFGNVLGSAGSVIPTFAKQIESGGPVTVTDPEITRFFMTIPEASKLILHASILGDGGEIFVLDMGKPIQIKSLAEQMISLSGKSLDEIRIEYTGLRPGEKMHEELSYSYEPLSETKHPQVLASSSSNILSNHYVDDMIRKALKLSNQDDDIALRNWLQTFIVTDRVEEEAKIVATV